MADVHSKATRSYNMSQIKNKNTKPEMLIRKFLFASGFRFRLHDNKLPGKPDIILPKYKTVILINGCFWHGHKNCEFFKLPKTRTKWWKNKIENNIINDKLKKDKLSEMGYRVIVIWECEIKSKTIFSELIENVRH